MPKEITPQVLEKIRSDVDKDAERYKQKISREEINADELEFSIDTFKLEHIASKRMEIDYSTMGMNNAVDALTTGYDKLMNKYYNKLLNLLSTEDKKVLVSAQRAWLSFRDAETKLIATMTKEEYSGGGTIQSNLANSAYNDLVVKRTVQIFNHYNSVIKK